MDFLHICTTLGNWELLETEIKQPLAEHRRTIENENKMADTCAADYEYHSGCDVYSQMHQV